MANSLKHKERSKRSSHNKIPVAMFRQHAEKVYTTKLFLKNRNKNAY